MKNSFDLTGKRAMVVGGAGDLGRFMVEGLLEAGASVAIVGRGQRLREVTENFRRRDLPVYAVSCDLADREQGEKAFAQGLELLGGLDILVNAAGIQRRWAGQDFPAEDWDAVLEVNLTVLFQFCQRAGRVMLAQGSGKIINVASMLSFFGGYTVAAYAASKGGVAQVTKALANEWACQGLNVNAIAPGYMATKMNTALMDDEKRNQEILSRIPQKRWGTGEDMKGITVFLASGASDYLNGAVTMPPWRRKRPFSIKTI